MADHDIEPKKEPAKAEEGARPVREIVSKLSEHEKTVRDQELLLNASKYFGGLSDEEKALLGLTVPEQAQPAPETALEAPGNSTDDFEIRSEWVWTGLTVLIFAGVVGWVLAGR